jgi:hypothetical protein
MFNSNDFTYDAERFAGLPQFARALHRQHMHYVVLIGETSPAKQIPLRGIGFSYFYLRTLFPHPNTTTSIF